MDGAADARMGDEDAVEALSGPGDVEGGAVEAVRDQRTTIHRRWIAAGQLDRDLSVGAAPYSARPPLPHKLDPYKGVIDAWLAVFPRLSVQRLFDEVRAAGYAGGYGRVRDYVRQVRPREPAEPVVRYETPLGRQGRWTSGRSRCRGGGATRCWRCSAICGWCGCASTPGRRWTS